MALYAPGSRLDGCIVRRGPYPQPSERRLRLEQGLERLHALFLAMTARWIDLLDEETIDADAEPSLGSLSAGDQRLWSAGGLQDHEGEHDGREPNDEGPDGDELDFSRCDDEVA